MTRFFIIIAALFISACSTLPTSRVAPEALLSASSEKVSFGLNGEGSLHAISTWIEGDAPTRAELSCPSDAHICSEVQQMLSNHSIPSHIVPGAGSDDSLTLLYERVVARDCPTQQFGCSVSVNSLQMVANHQQYVRPNLSDPQDTKKAVESYNSYAE